MAPKLSGMAADGWFQQLLFVGENWPRGEVSCGVEFVVGTNPPETGMKPKGLFPAH